MVGQDVGLGRPWQIGPCPNTMRAGGICQGCPVGSDLLSFLSSSGSGPGGRSFEMEWEESAPLHPHSVWALCQAGPQPSVLSAPQEQR